MILFVGNLKDYTHIHLLKPINTLSKVAGYKIDMQKSVAFLYTNNSKHFYALMNNLKMKLRKQSYLQ